MNKLLENINNWTQSGPMGNDKQVAWMLPAAGVATSLLGGLFGSKKSTIDPISPGQIREDMAPVQGYIDQMGQGYQQMQGFGRDMMDPGSAMNQQRFQMMQQQGSQQMALQNLLQRRQAAAMGQASGITAQQGRSAQRQLGGQLSGQFQQAMLGQQDKGLNMLGQSQSILGNQARMQMGVSENIAQARIAQNQAQRQEEMMANQQMANLFGGLGGGLLQGWAGSL